MDSATKSYVIGIIFSLLLALLIYWIEHKSTANEAKRAGISSALNMALLGVILTAIIANNFDAKDEMERAIPHVRSSILQSLVSDIADLDQATASYQANQKIHEITMDPLRQSVSHAISQAKQGIIETDSIAQTIDLTIDLMKEARKRVVMTSYIRSSDWWKTSAGLDYAKRAEDALRHVEDVERIFIVDNDDELRSIQETIRQQRAKGVKVKFVKSQSLDNNLKRDFIIIDDIIAGEMELSEDRKFKLGRFYTSRTMTEDYYSRFKQLNVWAQE